MIVFTDPYYLLLMIPVIGGLIFSYRHVHGMMRGRKRLAFALRFILATSLVLALAGPEAHRRNQGLCTIYVLDHSDSIREGDRAEALKFINEAMAAGGPEDQAALVVFGKEPTVDVSPGGIHHLDRILSVVDGSGTDMASAIRLASASFPDGKAKRIVLLSDGNETSGDATEAAQVAATDDIGIDYVAFGVKNQAQEVSVTDLDSPSESRAGQPFPIEVTAESTYSGSGTLNLDRDGLLVKSMPVTFSKGKNVFTFEQTVDDVGLHRYRAVLTSDTDTDVRNNVGMGFVAIRGKPKVLLVEETPGGVLAKTLRGQNIQVDDPGPSGLPRRAEDFQLYDAILFNDLNSTYVSDTQMKLIRSAVRDSGIGFAMIGGENSFLPGGWYNTPVADVLPVDLNIRQRRSFPSTSILLVIDTSGSMGMVEDGVEKVRLAAKAAEQTVLMMSPTDRVGVVGSTDQIEFVAPMQLASDKATIVAETETLATGGGGIYCQPSMEFAQKALEAETSKVRHLILLGDGNDIDLQDGSLEIAANMRADKITTSVIAIGDGKDVAFLKKLAATGGGQFYLATRAHQLPSLTSQDSAVIARSAIEEGAFMPKVAIGEDILRGIPTDSIPPLFGYCLSDSRPLAQIGMKTAKDDPLLATWQYGLGTSLAFTSDAQPRWASKWVPWGGFNQFWAQATRAIGRRASSSKYSVESRSEGSKGIISLKATDSLGNPINNLPAQVRISKPGGGNQDVTLTQSAPGQYSGSFEAGELGSYIVTVAEDDGRGGKKVSASGFSVPYPPEYRSTMANLPLLARISKITGGIELVRPNQAVRPLDNPGFSIQELWQLFLFLAAFLLPLDIACRRIALPFQEILAKLGALVRSRQAKRREQAAAQPVYVERLHAAKKRAAVATEEAPPTPKTPVTSGAAKPARTEPARKETPASASSSLLEAKKRRQDKGE